MGTGAHSVTLGWHPSTDPSAVGYAIYYGTSSGTYSTRIDAGTNTVLTIPGLQEGTTYYFAATAYNTSGAEGRFSGEISYEVPMPASPILVNGSFELGYSGWFETGNQMITDRASDGTNCVEFSAGNISPDGLLSQTFATTSGQAYTLSCDVGADWGGPTMPQSLQITVSGSRTLLSTTVTVYGPGDVSSLYISTNLAFTADGSTATLTFQDVSPSGIDADLLLDNVSVRPQTDALQDRLHRPPLRPSVSLAPKTQTLPKLKAVTRPSEPSAKVLSIALSPEGLRIQVRLTEKGSYELEGSSDLRLWQPLGSAKISGPQTLEFLDSAPFTRARFYRIVR